MSENLTKLEVDILRAIDLAEPIDWGAAVGAALERLKGSGYITPYIGAKPQLTEAGRLALKESRNG